ncbi:MAG: hypothetical protein HY958_12785 [Bacteroidia bacterium]|nr:hypothetical protein [Bacteroidia bacterium]
MKNLILPAILILIAFSGCQNYNNNKPLSNEMKSEKKTIIEKQAVDSTLVALTKKYGQVNRAKFEKSVPQLAALWQEKDGDAKKFKEFCVANFVNTETDLDKLFSRLSTNFETLYGFYNKISTDLKLPIHLDMGELLPIDEMFGGYEPVSNMVEDFFNNKIGFAVLLNFPYYSLKEKSELGKNWSRKQWAFARMGDIFASRVPSGLLLKKGEATMAADTYIAEYNIFMGNLIDDNHKTLFPKEMKLITHWGLRDELKANYSNKENGFAKQKMIYEVMKNIISQEIPESVINKNEYFWNPSKNTLFKDGKEIKFKPESNTRYKNLLNIFHAMKAEDPFNPYFPTYIERKFNKEMELSQEEVENLFIQLLSSPQVKKVADLISGKLGRKLEPFDIWYDGFKARGSISSEELDNATLKKYPAKDAFEKDLPEILVKLGFKKDKAKEICSKITVDASRGAGHALGSEMKSDKARLRTRVTKDGMNYKGYNIAVHEFGHNVEQTFSLQDVDYYMMRGVPNTAFTEALAFIFQKRDLELLGKKDNDPNKFHMMALDNFWACYEIMGVSLVDMKVWQWMYQNPDAAPEQLKTQVIAIAKDVWNKYYAPVFGIKDQPILAIYSHMIDAPLYLSAYPIGHLIDFQIEKQIKGKSFADEIQRIYTKGKLIPQLWMKEAVGAEISCDPILEATSEALGVIK